MNEKRTVFDALDAIADFLAEDVLAMSDEEIEAELIADGLDPEVVAEEGRQLIERVLAEHDRRKAATPNGGTQG